ncbi:MAG: hypothetical protein IKJ01_08945 [Lachnospiraceae bacterium]|nr:hypothetical protein [Lachnospiraceae bacterium]
MANKTFLSVQDVCSILECSQSKGYAIIRQLNEEMQQLGYITLHGKVNARFFYERIYAEREEENGK